jgi:uncharacterized protein (TIGR02118 family)
VIKVSVMYPNSPGARFDHDYYRDKRLPLIKNRMGAALKYYTIDKGLAGEALDAPAAYVGMCHCDSIEAYQSSFSPYAQTVEATVPVPTGVPVNHWGSSRPSANSRARQMQPASRQFDHWEPVDRGNDWGMSASAKPSTAMAAAFSASSRGSILSRVSAAV